MDERTWYNGIHVLGKFFCIHTIIVNAIRCKSTLKNASAVVTIKVVLFASNFCVNKEEIFVQLEFLYFLTKVILFCFLAIQVFIELTVGIIKLE